MSARSLRRAALDRLKVRIKDPRWIGNIDEACNGFVCGWLADAQEPESSLSLVVFVDGVPWAEAVTDASRPDTGLGRFARPGFFVHAAGLPAASAQQGRHALSVRVRVGDELVEAISTDVEVGRWERRFVGRLEQVTSTVATGWILDLARPERPSQGYLLHSTGFTLPLTTGTHREDLAAAFGLPGANHWGFSLGLDAAMGVSLDGEMALHSVSEPGALATLQVGAPTDEPDLAAVDPALRTGHTILTRRRHDTNSEYALLRSPDAVINPWVRRRAEARVLGALAEGRLSGPLHRDLSVASRPAQALYAALVEAGQLDPDDEQRLVEAGHESSSARAFLTLESLVHHLPGTSCSVAVAVDPAAFDGPVLEKMTGFPGPGLTAAQMAFWRLRHADIDVFTEVGLAELLARWITLLRRTRDAAPLTTAEQRDWLLALPRTRDRLALPYLSRFVIGRLAMVEGWTGFDLDVPTEGLALACDVAMDELSNGFGWYFLGERLRRRLLGDPDLGHPGALVQLAWLASRWDLDAEPPTSGPRARQVLSLPPLQEWYAELPPGHPLTVDQLDVAPQVDASPPAIDSVTVMGLLDHPSGVGTNADNSLAALRIIGVPVTAVPLDFKESRVGRELLARDGPGGATVLLHAQPEYIPSVLTQGAHLWDGVDRLIGFFAWEATVLPRALRPGARMVDEVWTPSEFCASAFREAGSRSVHVMPHAVTDLEHDDDLERVRARYALTPASHVVMTAFDAHSRLTRKNPLAAVRAFQAAFDDRDAALVLKARNWQFLKTQAGSGDEQARALLSTVSSDSRITLVTEELDRYDTMSLIAASNTYLSLHRAEGFGYTMAEAMAVGVPTVATGFSANTEFMTPRNSWLVDVELVPVQPGQYSFWQVGMEWAEPDVELAAKALLDIREDPDSAEEKAGRGRRYVREHHSLEAMARRYADVLQADS